MGGICESWENEFRCPFEMLNHFLLTQPSDMALILGNGFSTSKLPHYLHQGKKGSAV